MGKTTMSTKLIGKEYANYNYYSWDFREDRQKIMKSEWPGQSGLLILDELHKFRKWKAHLKGQYDKFKDRYKFLVTGSARLDVYRKGGDSLQGRYHYYRMHPFSLAELEGPVQSLEPFKELPIPSKAYAGSFNELYQFGGFPEPFLKQSKTVLRRWHNEKIERMFREDIRDLENIRDLDNMLLLSDLLPGKVGSLLSVNSLRSDLEVSHKALTSWLNILEAFYYQFRIYPYATKTIRSLKKDSKLYLWDWSEVEDENARFENMVGSHLLKFTHFLEDNQGYKANLFYLRNVQQKEVDFLVTVKNKPWFAVEVKAGSETVSPNLYYFKERMQIPFLYQVVQKSGIDSLKRGVRVISADKFLAGLV